MLQVPQQKCATVQETKNEKECSNGGEQKCDTVTEQQCTIENEQQCNTVNDKSVLNSSTLCYLPIYSCAHFQISKLSSF